MLYFHIIHLLQREIAYAPWFTYYRWDKYDTQFSERMYLEKGRPYYIEGDYYDAGGLYYLNIGLHKETTTLTNKDVSMAVQEQQHLKIYGKMQTETQVL